MSDRVWFVTGCSSGIGRSLAEGLIEAGERVVITARRPEQIADLAARAPDRVLPLPLDVTDEDSVGAAVAAAVAGMGRIDVLVNNAAVGLIAAVEESTAEEVEQMFRTNVLGVLAMVRAVAPHMRSRRSGYIMTVGSIGSFRGGAALGLYAATKHALAGINDALAAELGPLGVRSTLLALGSYRSGFRHRGMKHGEVIIDDYDETSGAVRRRLRGEYPAVIGDPATIAPALIKLADIETPPRVLALGADSVAGIRAKLEALGQEVDAWEALSNSAGITPKGLASRR